MKLIFMGTPEFAVPSLKKLVAAGHSITAVFTQPDKPVGRKQVITRPPVKIAAQELGLPVFQPTAIRKAQDEYEQIFRDADLAVVAAYGRILPDWMLKAPRYGCVNVHSSLLPKYRGAAPINWAIVNGETETGVTIMQMDAGLDTGDILIQDRLRIGENERTPELTLRLADLGADLLLSALQLIENGTIAARPQNESEATYAPLLKREDGLIDWKLTASQLSCRLRGFTPFPGGYTFLHDQKLEIAEATPVAGTSELKPGTVAEILRDGFDVACGGGTVLRVTAVQPAGKKVMMARDFLNGARVQIGDRLG